MKDGWYCAGGFYFDSVNVCGLGDGKADCDHCSICHRKHPTPEQFREEYRREVPDSMPVFAKYRGCRDFALLSWKFCRDQWVKPGILEDVQVICACTPFELPDDFEVAE